MTWVIERNPNEIKCAWESWELDGRKVIPPLISRIVLRKEGLYRGASWQIQYITHPDNLQELKTALRSAIGENSRLIDTYHPLNKHPIGVQLLSADKKAIATYLFALRKIFGSVVFDKATENTLCEYLGIQNLDQEAYPSMPTWIETYKSTNLTARYQNTRADSLVREIVISQIWPSINIDLIVKNGADLQSLRSKFHLSPDHSRITVHPDTQISWEPCLRVRAPIDFRPQLRDYMDAFSPSVDYMVDACSFLFDELAHMDVPDYQGGITQKNKLMFLAKDQPKIYKISADVESEYMALDYSPGPGTKYYSGREKEWEERKFVGCTQALGKHVEHEKEYLAKKIAFRAISTMPLEDELEARAKRTFTTPDTPMFKVINDPEGNYEQFCHQTKPRVAIHSGEKLYQPHTMIFKKVMYNELTKTWAGMCIGFICRGENTTVLDIVNADSPDTQKSHLVHHDAMKVT